MEITDQLVDKLAHLSRLNFNSEEKEDIKKDLGKMIHFVEKINELDLEDTAPQLHMTEGINVLREDKVKASINRDEALKNSLEHDDQFFLVPKAIIKPNSK